MSTALKTRIILFFIMACFTAGHCMAADTLSSTFPKAVLVMLRAEKKRIDALNSAHRYKQAAEVERDAAGERAAMIKDFERNFTARPVYFFIDTNADKIKEKHFDGVLSDTSGKAVSGAGLDSDYVIAFYGYLSTRYKEHRTVQDSLRQEHDAEVPFGRGLVITNEKFQEITYFYKLAYHSLLYKRYKKNRDLVYVSKHFDIEYFPFAKYFNVKLLDRQQMMDFMDIFMMYKREDFVHIKNEGVK